MSCNQDRSGLYHQCLLDETGGKKHHAWTPIQANENETPELSIWLEKKTRYSIPFTALCIVKKD
jgi:hypothetical protein